MLLSLDLMIIEGKVAFKSACLSVVIQALACLKLGTQVQYSFDGAAVGRRHNSAVVCSAFSKCLCKY